MEQYTKSEQGPLTMGGLVIPAIFSLICLMTAKDTGLAYGLAGITFTLMAIALYLFRIIKQLGTLIAKQS